MTTDLQLSGPTVTLFGGGGVFDQALSDEFGRRGCSTHLVSVPTGWLASVTHAVVRIDTPTGQQALTDLADAAGLPAAHVVVVCRTTTDVAETDRISELCRQCGDRHDVSLIWHDSLEGDFSGVESSAPAESQIQPSDLAASVADEVGMQEAWATSPSFATQLFQPHRHRGTV